MHLICWNIQVGFHHFSKWIYALSLLCCNCSWKRPNNLSQFLNIHIHENEVNNLQHFYTERPKRKRCIFTILWQKYSSLQTDWCRIKSVYWDIWKLRPGHAKVLKQLIHIVADTCFTNCDKVIYFKEADLSCKFYFHVDVYSRGCLNSE